MQGLASSRSGLRATAGTTQQRRLVRASALSGGPPLKRPELKRPEQPSPPPSPPPGLSSEGAAAAAAAKPAAAAAPTLASDGSVTIEYQRMRAKEMRKYFEDMRIERATAKAKVFGWTPANEIGDGRWAMFGFFVGALTEYATGVDFIHQIEQIITYTGARSRFLAS
ncbi:MAG: low CO2 and stress-induced one-helix protein [Monoraphidium minutum]|nr:MAG: low CO2 and stress-induced one-helix protein [Monoraphidium minutum]